MRGMTGPAEQGEAGATTTQLTLNHLALFSTLDSIHLLFFSWLLKTYGLRLLLILQSRAFLVAEREGRVRVRVFQLSILNFLFRDYCILSSIPNYQCKCTRSYDYNRCTSYDWHKAHININTLVKFAYYTST